MDKPNDSVTLEQRAELFELYKEHAEAMLRAGQAMQQEGMGARFIEEDGKASEIFRRVQELEKSLRPVQVIADRLYSFSHPNG